jgi:DNA-binding response OmpR family regulator
MQLLMIDAASSSYRLWNSALKSQGFGLDHFVTLADGIEAAEQIQYQMLLVSSRLPDGDSIDWLKRRRQVDLHTPFVIVAPSQDVETRVRALEHGVDDCFSETLDSRELVAKIRALLRRQPIVRQSHLQTGNIRLDTAGREIWIDDARLVIPKRELNILEHLMLGYNRTVTREYLEANIYGASREVCPNSVEVRISRLRRGLTQSGATVEIKTVRGIGYRLQPTK